MDADVLPERALLPATSRYALGEPRLRVRAEGQRRWLPVVPAFDADETLAKLSVRLLARPAVALVAERLLHLLAGRVAVLDLPGRSADASVLDDC